MVKLRRAVLLLWTSSLSLPALVWRRLLWRTRVIAITGSVGKTTAKECLAAILASKYPVRSTRGSSNGRSGIPPLVLGTTWRHRYLVAEVGILRPGRMWRSALLLRPDIVVVTAVGRQHMSNLRDLETVAREKARLLRPLRKSGHAILNGDDPKVAAMGASLPCPVSYFGMSPSQDVWADEVSFAWPKGLEFTVHTKTGSGRVETQLLGKHWAPSVLAAICAGLACGVSLEESIAALRDVKPFTARLERVELPCGAVVLRDEYNGSAQTFAAALEVLRGSRAKRRVAVFGRVSDHPDGGREGIRQVGRELAGVADLAIFVCQGGDEGCEAAREAGVPDARYIPDLRQAAEVLRQELRQGDIVLLKGVWDDHLSRLYFAQLGSVACWMERCKVTGLCDNCRKLRFRPEAQPATEQIGVG